MVKKVSVLPPRTSGRSVTDENLRARLDEQHEKKMELIRQFRAEHEKNEETEKNLKKMQMLSFEPADYEYLLEEEPWEEPQLTSFEYLKTEAIQRIELLYKNRLTMFAACFAGSFAFYLILPLMLAFICFLSLGLFLVYQTSQTLKQKQNDLISALEAAQEEILRRRQEEIQAIEEARKQHEFSQQLRREEYQSIMEGKAEVIGQLIKESLEKMAVPVVIKAAVDIAGPLVNISVTLPGLSVIPKRRTRMLPTGYLEYDNKQEREVNKQYMDLVTSLLLQICVRIFEIAPTVECIYARGSSEKDALLIHMRLAREAMDQQGNRLNPADMLNTADAVYSAGIDNKLLPLDDPGPPPEWETVESVYKVEINAREQN